MWFAVLGSYQTNQWYSSLVYRLLEGSRDVISLLETNPFPSPPRQIRSKLYNYHFTDFNNSNNVSWWIRESKG